MTFELTFDDFNARIAQLGYSAIAARDFSVLQAAFGPELQRWLAVTLERPSAKTSEWHALRSALFSVSAACIEALLRAGIDAPPLRLAKWLVEQGEQGRQMVRFAGQGAKTRQAASVVDELRGALMSGAAGHARINADIRSRTTRVFGTRYALTVEQAWNVHGQASLQVEMARKSSDGVHYDWGDKIAVMLAEHEVVGLIDVLSGRIDSFEVRHHGEARDKSMRVEAQPSNDGMYFNLRRAEHSFGVLVPRYQVFRVMALAMRAMTLNNPGMTSEEILALTKVVGERFAGAAVSA